MPEQGPQPPRPRSYHPSVEDVLETSGIDIGRVKQPAAQDIAGYPYVEGTHDPDRDLNTEVSQEIARRAIDRQGLVANMGIDAVNAHAGRISPEANADRTNFHVEKATADAKRALDSAARLSEKVEPIREAALEEQRLEAELAAVRKKIAELESQ